MRLCSDFQGMMLKRSSSTFGHLHKMPTERLYPVSDQKVRQHTENDGWHITGLDRHESWIPELRWTEAWRRTMVGKESTLYWAHWTELNTMCSLFHSRPHFFCMFQFFFSSIDLGNILFLWSLIQFTNSKLWKASICQQFRKPQQWPQDWGRSFTLCAYTRKVQITWLMHLFYMPGVHSQISKIVFYMGTVELRCPPVLAREFPEIN